MERGLGGALGGGRGRGEGSRSGGGGVPASTCSDTSASGEKRRRRGADGAQVGAEDVREALAGDRGEGGVAAGGVTGGGGGFGRVGCFLGESVSSRRRFSSRGSAARRQCRARLRLALVLPLSFFLFLPLFPTPTHRTRE